MVLVISSLMMFLLSELNPLGLLISALSLLGCLYKESWTINPGTQSFEHHKGLLFFYWITRYSYLDIEFLRLDLYRRGPLQQIIPMNDQRLTYASSKWHTRLLYPVLITLSFRHCTKGSITIEQHIFKRRDSLIPAAHALAKGMGTVIFEFPLQAKPKNH
jgi:hypothetical protein